MAKNDYEKINAEVQTEMDEVWAKRYALRVMKINVHVFDLISPLLSRFGVFDALFRDVIHDNVLTQV